MSDIVRVDAGKQSERIVAKVKVTGEYQGVSFEAESTNYYWVNENNEPSRFWWDEGNMSCDCNRVAFLPEAIREKHPGDCGHTITVFRIIPLEGDNLPIIDLTIDKDEQEICWGIVSVLGGRGFKQQANGNMVRSSTGCSFSYEHIKTYRSVVDFQLKWPAL